MDRFFLIDKPIGITSFDVLRKLRKIFGIKKLGHTGTLDPLATGLLLVAFGNYTKLIPYLEKLKKTYIFEISLDGTTPSFDKETEITFIQQKKQELFQKTLTLDFINKVLQDNFTGKINQIPPKYSAIKMGGEKALEKVRNGKIFEMKSREVEILNIKIIDFNYPKITLEAEVGAGTYIRSIANDLGNILKTGGYITKLRRTKIEDLDEKLSKNLENIKETDYLDETYFFKEVDFIKLDEKNLEKIDNGLKISGNFNFEIGKKLFIKREDFITNVLSFDGEFLNPVRKIK